MTPTQTSCLCLPTLLPLDSCGHVAKSAVAAGPCGSVVRTSTQGDSRVEKGVTFSYALFLLMAAYLPFCKGPGFKPVDFSRWGIRRKSMLFPLKLPNLIPGGGTLNLWFFIQVRMQGGVFQGRCLDPEKPVWQSIWQKDYHKSGAKNVHKEAV